MNREPTVALNPKQRFLANREAAIAHSDMMANPAFLSAASTALLQYQYQAIGGEPSVLAISAAKLRGAQEFLRVLLNLGSPERGEEPAPSFELTPPEQQLDSPFAPPTK